MERRLEKRNVKEMGRGHEGCKRKQCKLQMLLCEKVRSEGLIKEGRKIKAGPNFDDILLNNGYLQEDERRLCRVNRMIARIQEQGNCEGIETKGTVTPFVIEEPKPIPRPKPTEQATRAVA